MRRFTEYQSESKISLHGSVEHVPSPSPAGFFGDPLGFSSEKADVPSHFFSPLWGQCEGRLKACSKCDEFFFSLLFNRHI